MGDNHQRRRPPPTDVVQNAELGVPNDEHGLRDFYPQEYLNQLGASPQVRPLSWTDLSPRHSRAGSMSDSSMGMSHMDGESMMTSPTVSMDHIPSVLPPTPSDKTDEKKFGSDSGVDTVTSETVIAVPAGLTPTKLQGEKEQIPAYSPISADALVPIPRPSKDAPPPPKHDVGFWIKAILWYNAYRRFFTLVVITNGILIIIALAGHLEYSKRYPGAFVLGNFAIAILVRNELFGRLLYFVLNTLFAKWAPLRFRLAITSTLQHLGGIHSGCALSGFVWLLINIVDDFNHHDQHHWSILATGLITLIAICGTMTAAIPWVRNTHHNMFEKYHRFVGWTALVFTWLYTVLRDLWNNNQWSTSAVDVFGSQSFWFAFVMTIFVVLPWLFVRRVPLQIEIPSPKVAILRFERGMQQGLLGRISLTPFKEYHAFGIISAGTHSGVHYMICGVQGDFTKSLVNDPPKYIWTRELKFAGVSNTSALYKRGIRICTGTGLGAALSTCIQSPDWFLIWIGSEMEKTFGPTIAALINDNLGANRVLLWDSKARGGRPNTMKILKEVYRTWNAEVVFITSNYEGNKEMMEGCTEAGIPVFGTLWDF